MACFQKQIAIVTGCAIVIMLALAAAYLISNKTYENGNSNDHAYGDLCDPDSNSLLINGVPTEKAQAIARCEHQEKQEKAALDRRIADATDNLAAYTLGLTIATCVLAFFTAGLVVYAVRQAGDAKTAADASARSARAAEMALEGADSPFLYPRAWGFNPERDPAPPGAGVGFAAYELCNVGRSPAIVREVYEGLIRCQGLPDPLSFPPPQTNILFDIIIPASGKSDPRRFTRNSIEIVHGIGATYLMGQVRFSDVFDNQFLAAFCLIHNSSNNGLFAVGGREFNYQRKLSEEERAIANQRDQRQLA